jgi:hypothetical protein
MLGRARAGSRNATMTTILEKLNAVGFDKLSSQDIKEIYEQHIAGQVEATVLTSAIAESAGAAKSAVEALRSMAESYTSSEGTEYAEFSRAAAAVVAVLQDALRAPDLDAAARERIAVMVLECLRIAAEVKKHQAEQKAGVLKVLGAAVVAVAGALIYVLSGGRARPRA